jgi:2-dehydropantoate 2-reductase
MGSLGMTIGADQRIAILGPGAVGGYMAVAAKQHGLDPICIAKESTAELINQEGIIIESEILGALHQKLRAVSRLTQPVDWLIVTPKSQYLLDALQRIDPSSITSDTKILPLLNGIEHFEVIRSIFPKAKLIYSRLKINF